MLHLKQHYFSMNAGNIVYNSRQQTATKTFLDQIKLCKCLLLFSCCFVVSFEVLFTFEDDDDDEGESKQRVIANEVYAKLPELVNI